MYETRQLKRLCLSLEQKISDNIDRAGLFYRIFSRVKSPESSLIKIKEKGYDGQTSFLQDVIGIRIVVYFPDDIEELYTYLKNHLDFIDETIDDNGETVFAPTRTNLIFKIPVEFRTEFRDHIQTLVIAETFEVQLRTMLSEGWHEVEHDMRYKCKEDWAEHATISRQLNSVLGAIESNESNIVNILSDISYLHYKDSNIEGVLRSKFRLRFVNKTISPELKVLITNDFLKIIFKINRKTLINFLLQNDVVLPLSLDNVVFILNHITVKNPAIYALMPNIVSKELHYDKN